MDPLEIASWNRQVTALLSAAGEHDRVITIEQVFHGNVDADMSAVMKRHTFAFHLRDAAIDVVLLHLEVRNAVAQQTASLGELLEDMDVVASPRELLGACEPCRSGADDCDLLARF